MKTIVTLALLGAVIMMSVGAAPRNEGPERMLSHVVFFKLRDGSEKARESLVEACQKYLSDHPGTVWYGAGVVADEYDREVNDRDFDVALHIVFGSKAAHDRYQTAPRHEQFIEEQRGNWEKVRVFDSWIGADAVRPAGPAK
jgi:hypothetical protein